MALWDAPYMLQKFIELAGLQQASEIDPTNDTYPRLADAQLEVIGEVASRFPKAVYQGPVTITSSDGGFTFGFGVDGGNNPIVPQGWVQVAITKSAFSGDTFSGWVEGRDFLNEGSIIRMPSNRTYKGPLYARFVPTPPTITSTQGSIINPAIARRLIVIRAVRNWAAEGALQSALVAQMNELYRDRFSEQMLAWRRTYPSGGILQDPARWYFTSPDLGSGTRSG